MLQEKQEFSSFNYSAHLSRNSFGNATLTEGYFGDEGMLAYVKGIQRQEIRRDMSSVKHQDLAGSTIGDTHKEYFSGDKALKAGGKDNTMNQF